MHSVFFSNAYNSDEKILYSTIDRYKYLRKVFFFDRTNTSPMYIYISKSYAGNI